MAKHAALIFLGISSPLILLTFIVGGPAGEVLFALLAAVFPVALMALGGQRRGRLGPVLWPLAILMLILVAGVAAMLLLRGQITEAPWTFGLPLATAIQFYGLFLLPVVVVSLAYAYTFERSGLRQDDLDELRRRFENPPESD